MLLFGSHAGALIRLAVIIKGLHLRWGLKMHRLMELLTRCSIYDHTLASLCTWSTAWSLRQPSYIWLSRSKVFSRVSARFKESHTLGSSQISACSTFNYAIGLCTTVNIVIELGWFHSLTPCYWLWFLSDHVKMPTLSISHWCTKASIARNTSNSLAWWLVPVWIHACSVIQISVIKTNHLLLSRSFLDRIISKCRLLLSVWRR